MFTSIQTRRYFNQIPSSATDKTRLGQYSFNLQHIISDQTPHMINSFTHNTHLPPTPSAESTLSSSPFDVHPQSKIVVNQIKIAHYIDRKMHSTMHQSHTFFNVIAIVLIGVN